MSIKTCAIFVVAALAGGACGKGGGGGNTGAYKELRDGIHGGDDFTAAAAKVEAKLGPAHVKDDNTWRWAAVDGDDCFDLDLFKNGDKVAGTGGGKVNKMVESQFDECKTIAGATAAK